MSKTPNSTYRLPPAIKSKLSTLAKIDGYNLTDALKKLINQAYMARQAEIKDYRENLKPDENGR